MSVRARLSVAAPLALAAALVAGPAAGEPPQDLADELTDLAGVVEDAAQIEAALDELARTTELQLFVVYVDTFDGMNPELWADRSADLSRLGADDVLLAVAVEDRTYQVSVAADAPLTDEQLRRVEREAIEPALRDGDWGGAAIAAAEAYADAVTPAQFPTVPVLGGLGVVVAAAGGTVLWRRRRAAAEVRAELEELDKQASLALVAADDAVQRSATELGFAEAQFGPDRVAPFHDALARARRELTAAFGLRQRLDDADPETDDERRTMLRRVLEHCSTVDATLDEQTEKVEALRDLWASAPDRLAELRTRTTTVRSAADGAQATLDGLRARFTTDRLTTATTHPEEARGLAAQAADKVESGLATVDSDRGAAVTAAHEAEDLLGRAQTLLDVVTGLAAELHEAPERIDDAVASLTDDLTDVARLAGGDQAIAAAETEARAAITAAATQRTSGDPLGALERLTAAEATLDALLEPLREHERRVERARSRLGPLMAGVSRDLTSTTGVVSANRSAIGPVARTRLSEAQRQAEAASAQLDLDPLAALVAAEAAARLVAEARRRASADIDAYRSRSSGGYGGGYRTGWGGSGRSGGYRSSSSSRSRSSTSRSSGTRRSTSSRSSSRSSSTRSRRGGGGRF